MMRTFLFIALIATGFNTQAQNFNNKVSKAVQIVYNEYKLYFDSSLLSKYVVLDKEKSYLVNSGTQKIRAIVRADDAFAFDEFSLSFAIVYNGDTIRHLPPCRLDTFGNLMALGTPSNPIHHGDALPPYMALVKGNIKFDYKKLKSLLQKMKLEATMIDLQETILAGTKMEMYFWVVTTACPEIKCRELKVLAFGDNGTILADKIPD